MPVLPRLCGVSRLAVLVLLGGSLLGGCSLIERWSAPPEPVGSATAEEEPVPVEAVEAAVVPEQAEVDEGCALVFTEADANAAFAVIGRLATDCEYDGVKVQKDVMSVRWKPDPDSSLTAEIQPVACGEGDAIGDLLLVVPPATRARCPQAVESLEIAMRANLLPAGSYR